MKTVRVIAPATGRIVNMNEKTARFAVQKGYAKYAPETPSEVSSAPSKPVAVQPEPKRERKPKSVKPEVDMSNTNVTNLTLENETETNENEN